MNEHSHKHHIEETLFIVFILTFIGGFLDSYTYILFDKIFANTQTGNLIFFSIYLTEGNFYQAFIRLMPILSFCISIFMTQALMHHLGKEGNKIWIELILIINILLTLLIGIGVFKGHILVTSLISFICASMISTFKKAKGDVFAPTMCTGNLRSCVEKFSKGILRKDVEARKSSFKYLFIIVVFCIGVSTGLVLGYILGQYSIMITTILFVIILFIIRYHKKANLNIDIENI